MSPLVVTFLREKAKALFSRRVVGGPHRGPPAAKFISSNMSGQIRREASPPPPPMGPAVQSDGKEAGLEERWKAGIAASGHAREPFASVDKG